MCPRHLFQRRFVSVAFVLALAACNNRPDAEAVASTNDNLDLMEVARYRLSDVAASGKGDVEKELERAVAAGDFRFIGYSSMVPGIFPAAYGVECRPSVWSNRAFVGAMFLADDVPVDMDAERQANRNFTRFGAAYNAALLTHPRFPYRDLCRAVPLHSDRESARTVTPPSEYGFRNLRETDDPIDLGEAARRGTVQGLKRLLAQDSRGANRPDIVGITPFGWAIIYGRDEHAALLLAAVRADQAKSRVAS